MCIYYIMLLMYAKNLFDAAPPGQKNSPFWRSKCHTRTAAAYPLLLVEIHRSTGRRYRFF